MSLDDESSSYTIISSLNGSTFSIELDLSLLSLSAVIQEQRNLDPTATQFEVKDVSQSALNSIKEYLEHHQGQVPPPIPSPLKSNQMSDAVSDPWDATFIDNIYATSSANLRNIGQAALLLDIKPLFELVCAKWATLIRGLPIDQAKEILSK